MKIISFKSILSEVSVSTESRILALDVNTKCVGDLDELELVDFQNHPTAACHDYLNPTIDDLINPSDINPSDYRNRISNEKAFLTDVLVIDVEKWNQLNLINGVRNLHLQGYTLSVALNIVHKGHWLILEPKWNCNVPVLEPNIDTRIISYH